MTGDTRLARRTLFRSTGAALVTTGLAAAGMTIAGCDANGTASPGSTPALGSPGGPAVITWGLLGGYTGVEVLAMRPLRLAIYGDGETIADAAYRTTLPANELAELLRRLTDDLRAPHTVARTDGATAGVTDAPTTVITVAVQHGRLEARANGLDELRHEVKYSSSLYDARDRLGTVHKTVVATAQPYLSERVRLVAVGPYTPDDPRDAQPWPVEVPVPEKPGPENARYLDLDGEAARSVVRRFTRDLDQRGTWPVYRLTDGPYLRASWRYLLPDE